MKKITNLDVLAHNYYKPEELVRWIEMTWRYKLNPEGMIPIAASYIKSTSKFLKSNKEAINKMVDTQALNNLLCLENIRYE